ncbi:MAG: tetratricopeptide repeat protein [Candidatus Krumholzibacteria bacterium]|nr:tetratricopeptide repeat protein [Candidatus Krumholzibacteria bacterium]
MTQTTPVMRPRSAGAFRTGALLFCLALAVRLVFIAQYSSNPSFEVPVVDSATYDEAARALALEGRATPHLFWHGALYPLLLAGVYLVTGGSILAARLAQALLGAGTAVLSWRIGRRVFGEAAGRLAGAITALYAPLFFFETELLATGAAAFLAAASILAALEIDERPAPAVCIGYGLLAGLSVLARATFIPVVAATLLWLAFHPGGRERTRKGNVLRAGLAAASVAAVLIPVAVLSHRVTGLASPLPRSGSINLFIGNNPDTDRTLMIRPGAQWRELLRAPLQDGCGDEACFRNYFYDRVGEYVSTRPASFAAGLAVKASQMLSTRELPRTYDIYASREYSILLSALVWKIGRFGFPFGILMPLALYGLAVHRKRIRPPLWIFLGLYPAAIVLVFVSARYRAPIVPVLAAPAAAGTVALARLGRGPLRRAAATLFALAAVSAAASVSGPWIMEKFDYAAELHCCVGYQFSLLGRHEGAERQLRMALERDPRFPTAHRLIGCVLQAQGRNEEALDHFRLALELEPDSYTVHYYLGIALLDHGRIEDALHHLRIAAEGARKNRDAPVYEQAQRALSSRKAVEAPAP